MVLSLFVRAVEQVTPYGFRTWTVQHGDDERFGEGAWSFIDTVPWAFIETCIRKTTEGESVPAVVAALARAGWGDSDDSTCTVTGDDILRRKVDSPPDRLQLMNHVLPPNDDQSYYLYYWDDRDGAHFQGWWIANTVGSATYTDFAKGGPDTTPATVEDWEKEQTSDFRASKTGFVCMFWGKESNFDLTKEINHGKPVYKLVYDPLLRDRCKLLTQKILMPLLRRAGEAKLTSVCKAFARYLLRCKIPLFDRAEVEEEAKLGLKKLENKLSVVFEEVKGTLHGCGPPVAMVHQGRSWRMLNQTHVHQPLEWLKRRSMCQCLCALGGIGYSLEDICQEMTKLGFTNKGGFFQSVSVHARNRRALWACMELMRALAAPTHTHAQTQHEYAHTQIQHTYNTHALRPTLYGC